MVLQKAQSGCQMSIEKMSINDKRESKHASKSNEVLTLMPKMSKFCSLEPSDSFNVYFLRSHMIIYR